MNFSNLGTYSFLTLMAVLAPSPLPIPLDGIVAAMIAKGFSPTAVIFITVIANFIGSFIIFKIGSKSRNILAKLRQKKKKPDQILAENIFKRYGKYALLLGGIPFLGDAIIFLSGFYRLSNLDFFTFFLIGKFLWYILLSLGVIKLF